MTKPRLSPADQQAYNHVATLAIGAAVKLEGAPATFDGMTGYLIESISRD